MFASTAQAKPKDPTDDEQHGEEDPEQEDLLQPLVPLCALHEVQDDDSDVTAFKTLTALDTVVTASWVKTLERNLEGFLWRMNETMCQDAEKYCMYNADPAQTGLKSSEKVVMVGAPENMTLLFVGQVSTLPSANAKKICELPNGLQFFCHPPPGPPNCDAVVPAWHAKPSSKKDLITLRNYTTDIRIYIDASGAISTNDPRTTLETVDFACDLYQRSQSLIRFLHAELHRFHHKKSFYKAQLAVEQAQNEELRAQLQIQTEAAEAAANAAQTVAAAAAAAAAASDEANAKAKAQKAAEQEAAAKQFEAEVPKSAEAEAAAKAAAEAEAQKAADATEAEADSEESKRAAAAEEHTDAAAKADAAIADSATPEKETVTEAQEALTAGATGEAQDGTGGTIPTHQSVLEGGSVGDTGHEVDIETLLDNSLLESSGPAKPARPLEGAFKGGSETAEPGEPGKPGELSKEEAQEKKDSEVHDHRDDRSKDSKTLPTLTEVKIEPAEVEKSEKNKTRDGYSSMELFGPPVSQEHQAWSERKECHSEDDTCDWSRAPSPDDSPDIPEDAPKLVQERIRQRLAAEKGGKNALKDWEEKTRPPLVLTVDVKLHMFLGLKS